MMWKVMKFEWRMLRADRTTLIVVSLFVPLTGYALWSGMSGLQQRQMAAREFAKEQEGAINRARRVVEEDEAQAKAKGEPLDPARIGPRQPFTTLFRLSEFQVSLPPLSSAALGRDQGELFPATYKYRLSDGDFVPSLPTGEARSLSGLIPERPVNNPLELMLGRFDLGFIVLYIYPLVILALSFNLLSAERESGALASLLSQPIRLRSLVLGKLAVRAALVFVMAALLPGLAIYAGQKITGLETNLVRLLFWVFAVSAYGAFWFALSVWVNAGAHGAARNALALFIAWIVIVIIIPSLGGLLAQTLFPAPAGADVAEAERSARFEAESSVTRPVLRILDEMGDRYPIIEGKEETMERYRRAVYTDLIEIPSDSVILNRFLRERPEIPRRIAAYQLRAIGRQARNESIEGKLAPLLAERHERQQRQQLLIASASLLSPTLALQKAVSGIAGADRSRHERFLDQLDRHIRGVYDLLLPRIYRSESVRASDFERIKAFEFAEETNGAMVARLMSQFAILTMLALLMSLFATRALRRFSAIA